MLSLDELFPENGKFPVYGGGTRFLRNTTQETCPTCGKDFVRIFGAQKYCSSKCCKYSVLERRDKKRERMVREYREQHPKECPQCSKSFIAKANHQIFCSIECNKDVTRLQLRAIKYSTTYQKKLKVTKPWLTLLWAAMTRAKKQNVPFDLSREWVEQRWTGRCELTGIPFEYNVDKITVWAPSIDKIDPPKGYIQSNCRFILFGLNIFKYTGTDADMYTIAEALIRHNSFN